MTLHESIGFLRLSSVVLLGVAAAGLGFGLALGNWAGALALLTCTGIGYAYRIKVEESALSTAIGAPYKKYMQRTSRLIPFLL